MKLIPTLLFAFGFAHTQLLDHDHDHDHAHDHDHENPMDKSVEDVLRQMMSNLPELSKILTEAANNRSEEAEPPIPSENYRSTTTSSPTTDLQIDNEPEVSTGDSIGATTEDTSNELFTVSTGTTDSTVTDAVKPKALPVDETEKEDFCKTECPNIVGEPCAEVATEPEPCPTVLPCEPCVTCAPEAVTEELTPCPIVECPTIPPPTNTTIAPQNEKVDTKFALSISTTRAFYAGTDDLVFLNLVGEDVEEIV